MVPLPHSNIDKDKGSLSSPDPTMSCNSKFDS